MRKTNNIILESMNELKVLVILTALMGVAWGYSGWYERTEPKDDNPVEEVAEALLAHETGLDSDFYVIRSMTIGTTVTINTVDNGGCEQKVEKDKRHNPRNHERTNYVERRNEGIGYIDSTSVCGIRL